MFKERGFKNYRGRVGIDNVIFNYVVRVGKASFGNVFYDIKLEVDSYLPHSNDAASDIKNESTSDNNISRESGVVKKNLADKLLSGSDSEYLELAKNPKANETKLREMVEERFYVAFYLIKQYNKKVQILFYG